MKIIRNIAGRKALEQNELEAREAAQKVVKNEDKHVESESPAAEVASEEKVEAEAGSGSKTAKTKKKV